MGRVFETWCRCVALCFVIRRKGQFWAASVGSNSSMPNKDMSRQHFESRWRMASLLQLSGGLTNRIQFASFTRVTCPNRQSWWDLTMEVVESLDLLHHSWRSHASEYLRSFKGTSDAMHLFTVHLSSWLSSIVKSIHYQENVSMAQT